MFGDLRAALRGLGALGATLVVLATFLPWYVFEVVLRLGGITHVFAVPITLWGLTTIAPILLVSGAVLALVCLTMIDSRVAGILEALIGLGIAVYAFVRCFDIPNLGVGALPRGARATTGVEGGPFLALLGGMLLLIGSLGDLQSAPDEAGAGVDAEAPAPGGRFHRRRAPLPMR